MLYDTTLLRTFVAICDAGSFTKAAHQVNLTQSAVSHHVRRLEDRVGLPLIVRNTRGLRLTEKGEVLLCYARRILALYKEADQRLGRDSSLVRIGAPEVFDMRLLSPLLAKFSDCHPAVQIQVEFGISVNILALLEKGDLDLAIVFNELGEAQGTTLSRARRVWAGTRSMQLDPEEPAPLALYPPCCPWRKVALDELDRVGRACTIMIQGTGTSILSAVEAGLAITIFAESALPPTLKVLGAAEGLPPLPDFEFGLRRSPTSSPAAERLSEMITKFYHRSTAFRPENDQQRARIES